MGKPSTARIRTSTAPEAGGEAGLLAHAGAAQDGGISRARSAASCAESHCGGRILCTQQDQCC